jgi:hypothetical protein
VLQSEWRSYCLHRRYLPELTKRRFGGGQFFKSQRLVPRTCTDPAVSPPPQTLAFGRDPQKNPRQNRRLSIGRIKPNSEFTPPS